MNYGALQYSLKDRAYDIFLSGCKAPHCKGCQNPDLWKFNVGDRLDPYVLVSKIDNHISMIDRIRIMGGEPLDQPLEDLEQLVQTLEVCYPKHELWIFTRYDLHELSPHQEEILEHVDFVKHGRYMEEIPPRFNEDHNLMLASGNQYVLSHPCSDLIKGLEKSY